MERLVRMLARLSPESVYRRFFTAMPKLTSGFLRSLVGLASFHRDARAPVVAHIAVLVAR